MASCGCIPAVLSARPLLADSNYHPIDTRGVSITVAHHPSVFTGTATLGYTPVTQQPLISCLTVSTGRLRLLKQAIDCYTAQTWSRRELVIVLGGSPRYQAAVADHISRLGNEQIRLVPAGPGLRLGEMRNLSLESARGDFVCQWDDDDLYHPERLSLQYAALARDGADACYLTDLLQFFTDDRALYWLDWSRFAPLGAAAQMLPGSLLARNDGRLRYGEADRGEDVTARDTVFERMKPMGLAGHGFLYVYRYHGANVWPRRHHEAFRSTALDAPALRGRASLLRRALAAFRLPQPFEVRARDGQPALVYDGPRPSHRIAAAGARLERPAW